MPIQGDQRSSSPRSKIARTRATLPSISCERRRLPHSHPSPQPKCEAGATPAGAGVTGHSTEVIDVNQAAEATASETLARILADYGSGSDDAETSKEVPEVIDVDQAGRQAADSRMNDLRKKWTAQVKVTQQGKDREQVQLPEPLIEKLETMIKSKSKRAKNVRTSWSLEDKQIVLAVFLVLNRK